VTSTSSRPTTAPTAPRRPSTAGLCLALTAVLAGSIVCGVALGPVGIPFGDVLRFLQAALTGGTIDAAEAGPYRIVWDIRLPRVLLAAVVGAGLSVVGVAIQAMVRNALADPYVLGISSGASVGATAVATTGLFASLGIYALSTAAFLAALAAMAIVYLVAGRNLTPLRLVLTGTAMAYGFSAIAMLLVFQSPRGEAARAAMFWLLGSLGGVTWASLPIAAAVVGAGIVYLRTRAKHLNALSMGDETATTLGIDVSRTRQELFLVTAAMTGVLVAVSGAVGFVGLMLPHLVRLIVGADHRKVLAVAPLAGACFLIWVDVAARLLAAPEELPLGVITAALGVPCFILLMRRRGYVFGGR
jgi:iron complex transport system permease protein